MKKEQREPSEEKVGRLISGVPPTLRMPQPEKARALAALLSRAAPGGRLRLVRSAVWARTAAVAAAFLAIGIGLTVFWPQGGSVGVVWADVAERFDRIETFGAPLMIETVAPDGRVRVVSGRVFYKDPGMARYELSAVDAGEAEGTSPPDEWPSSVYIVRQLPEDTVVLELIADRRQAVRTLVDYTGVLLGPWREQKQNFAFFGWWTLNRIAAEATRVIGRGRLAGEPVIGFEAPLARAVEGMPVPLEPDGEIRVWASEATAIPLAVELVRRPIPGWTVTERLEPIDWNAPLPDSLFDDSEPEGYEVIVCRAHNRGFPAPRLQPHVTLRIGPEAGEPLVTEREVVGAVTGTVSFDPRRRPRYRTWIAFELTEQAMARLRRHFDERAAEPLRVDFNGEFDQPWREPQVNLRSIQIEVTPLRKRLIDFETDYLGGPEGPP